MNDGSNSSTGTGALSVRGSGQRVVSTRSGIPALDWLSYLIWHDGKLFGIDWSVWKVVGWVGNAVFFSRFFVQWYATEKLKRVVVPVAFWWLSLSGSFLLLIYSLRQRDSVFIFAYAFTWIPYIRNLMIHSRHEEAHLDCPDCGKSWAPPSNFCSECGARLAVPAQKAFR